MAKTFSLAYTFETLENHMTFFKKPMFGGLSIYLHGRMMMILMENPGDRSYRGQDYPYDVWNGILLPMERSSHESLQREFPELVSHPVLGKWLYLPMSAQAFELHIERIVQLIKLDDLRFGVYPKPRATKKSKDSKVGKKIATKSVAKSLKTTTKKLVKKVGTKVGASLGKKSTKSGNKVATMSKKKTSKKISATKPLAKKKTLKRRNARKRHAAEKALRLAKMGMSARSKRASASKKR